MSTSSTLRRVAVGVLSTAAGAALVLGTGIAGADAATPAPAGTASTCTFGQHLRHAWGRIPDQLRSDLEAARAMPAGADRRAALKKIRDTALAGGYGEATKVRATWLKDHRGKLRPLPDALKSDLAKLKGESRAERVTGLEDIATKAVDGDYGATVESFAKAVQSSEAWKDCATSGS